MTSGVYALLDKENTVRYVGQSKHIEKRFSHHKCMKPWAVKWLCLQKEEHVIPRLAAEREWVSIFWGFLENKTRGGEFSRDSILPSTSKKLSESTQSYWDDPEWRRKQTEKIGSGIRAIPAQQRVEIAKERWRNPVTAQTITDSLKRKGACPDYQEKKRQIAKRVFLDPAVHEKLRAGAKRRWTVEARERASQYMKIRMSNPEEKARMTAAIKAAGHASGYRHTAEAKAKISAAAKGNQWNVGKTLSAGTRAKISAAQKGNPKHRRIK